MDSSKQHSRCLSQAFGDMIRVSNNLLIDALKRGMVVESISMYGLLMAHNKRVC